MRNSFNLLLVSLAASDTVYVLGAMLEALRSQFGVMTHAHLELYPQFLYPLHTIAMTWSIVMTVAIALER
jgi:hypothetical protein